MSVFLLAEGVSPSGDEASALAGEAFALAEGASAFAKMAPAKAFTPGNGVKTRENEAVWAVKPGAVGCGTSQTRSGVGPPMTPMAPLKKNKLRQAGKSADTLFRNIIPLSSGKEDCGTTLH